MGMTKVTIISCDLSDLKEALMQLDQVPIVIRESTSERDLFPTVKEMCDGLVSPEKVQIINGPAAHKREIMALYDSGLMPRGIATKLGLKFNSVRDLVYRERKKALRKELENYPSPEVKAWIEEAPKASRIDDLSVDEELCHGRSEKAALVPTATHEPTRQDQIDAIILDGSKTHKSHLTIATLINGIVGGNWLPDDVSKRLKEIREEGKP